MNDYMTPQLRTWRRRTDGPLLVVAIGSLPLLLLELIRYRLPYNDRVFLDVVNVLVLVAFALDYIVELVFATRRWSYVRHEWTSLVIVLAQGIAVLPALVSAFAPIRAASSLRVLRVGRAWRVVAVVGRVVAIGGASAHDGRTILRRHAVRFALSIAAFTMVTAGVGFTLVEDLRGDHHAHSFFDALWWSAATMTTVGSDVQPATAAGRLIALVTVLVGISAASIITAKVAEVLVRMSREDAAAAAQMTG
jgi:voltage-gated potassium channel